MKLPATITETRANNTIPVMLQSLKILLSKERQLTAVMKIMNIQKIIAQLWVLLGTKIIQLQECKLTQLTVWRALTEVLNHQFMRIFNNM